MEPMERRQFATTQWSMVRAAADSDLQVASSALQELCQSYWYPLYTFVRRKGYSAHDAADLTQAFFADLLEREDLKSVDPQLGKFRSFLLAAIKHFVANQWKKEKAQKRGGDRQRLSLDFESADRRYQLEPVEDQTPEVIFQKQWAQTLLNIAKEKLRKEFANKGKSFVFEALAAHLAGNRSESTLADIAKKLEMTEVAVKVTLHRMRQRFGEILRSEISETVDSPEEIDIEIQQLFEVLRS